MDGSDNLQRAEHLLDVGRPADAAEAVRRVLAQDPSSVRAHAVLAQALGELNQHAEAVEVARRGLALAPESISLRTTLAEELLDLGQVEEARHLAHSTVGLAPNSWITHYTYARSLIAGRRPRARDAFVVAQHVLVLAPNSPDAHNLIGLCLRHLGKHDQARAAFTKALEIDPNHAPALTNLAGMDLGFFRLRKAARGLGAAVAIDPQHPAYRSNLHLLVSRLSARALLLILLGAIVLGIAVASEARWEVRALLGAALVGASLWLVQWSRSHLPRGLAGSWRTLFGDLGWADRARLGLTCVALAALTVMAFAPHDIALAAGGALLLLTRILLVIFVIGAVVGAGISLARGR